MNIQSPTSLLNSIQFMRSKLRSDKQTLMDIKNDFSNMGKKPRPPPIETILEESLKQNSQQNMSISKDQYSTEKNHKTKIIEMKRDFQKEMGKIKKQHQQQIQLLIQGFARERNQMQSNFRQKEEEQAKYIAILEGQIQNSSGVSPIHSEREKASSQQYDCVINQLLQQNNRLHTQLQQARDESEQWRKQSKKLWIELEARSRLKFSSKVPKDRFQSIGSKQNTEVKSILIGDQNTDRSNISSKWSDVEIQNDQGKLKTIKQFATCISKMKKEIAEVSKLR